MSISKQHTAAQSRLSRGFAAIAIAGSATFVACSEDSATETASETAAPADPSPAAPEAPAPEAPAPEAPAPVAESALPTQVVARTSAQQINDTWGELDLHFNEVSTYGTEKMVTGIADLLPGQEIHPPHDHEEEEYLFVSHGSGTWTVGEESFAANAGDLLYAAPWVVHGITNTGTENLTFFFFKWNNKGVTPPTALTDVFSSMSSVTQQSSAERITDTWGTLDLYTNEVETFGMEKVVTGIADILPGQEIHPPHAHEEEEFLYVVSGAGTWSVNGEASSASSGDLLYAGPWMEHGITNTGTEPLRFYFIKWNNQGVTPPDAP